MTMTRSEKRWAWGVLALAFTLAAPACGIVDKQPTDQLHQIVPSKPPDPKPETRPANVPPGNLWAPGYWEYLEGAGWVWHDGRIEEGKRGWDYVPAQYDWDGKQWVFTRPHWKQHVIAAPASAPAPAPTQTPTPTPASGPTGHKSAKPGKHGDKH
jgi:hypothetical protein